MRTVLTYYPSCPDNYEPTGYTPHVIQVNSALDSSQYPIKFNPLIYF